MTFSRRKHHQSHRHRYRRDQRRRLFRDSLRRHCGLLRGCNDRRRRFRRGRSHPRRYRHIRRNSRHRRRSQRRPRQDMERAERLESRHRRSFAFRRKIYRHNAGRRVGDIHRFFRGIETEQRCFRDECRKNHIRVTVNAVSGNLYPKDCSDSQKND